MTKHNAANERIKRRYFAYLKEAKRHSEATVDAAAKALHRFETYTRYREFKTFHFEQAIAFKKQLAEQRSEQSGERLSKATVHATLSQLQRFFQWLAFQPGFKSRFQYSDADYFNLSDKDTRIATAQREQRVPTLEQVKYVISRMPINTEIERRNRALIAFTLLTGARDGAIASTKLKHVDLVTDSFYQDAREVNTKFRKTFRTFFFRWGMKFAGLSWSGCHISARRNCGAMMIHFSRQRALCSGQLVSSKCLAWSESTGRAPRQFARYFAKPSSMLDCHTSIPIASEIHS